MKSFVRNLTKKTNPIYRIGFTDSGLGSLIFALDFLESSCARIKELSTKYNCEFQLIQLGDNANVPYSTKTPQEVNRLISSSLFKLEEQDCKIGVVACNTACIDNVKFHFLKKIKPFTIVDESAKIAYQQAISSHNFALSDSVGIIIMGTQATIKSQDYQHRITALHQQRQGFNGLNLYGFSAPEFVTQMETQYLEPSIMNLLVKKTLERMYEEIGEENISKASNIALFCTHYPLFKKEISENLQAKFGKKFNIITQGQILSDKILDMVEKDLEIEHLAQKKEHNSEMLKITDSVIEKGSQDSQVKIYSSFTDNKAQQILEHNIRLVYDVKSLIFNDLKKSLCFTK